MSDAITLKFTIKYDLLEENEYPGYVCSLRYPFLKKSAWHLLVTDGQTKEKLVIHNKMLVKGKNEATFEMKRRFGQAGTFNFFAYFINDSYIGFDKEVELKFDVKREDEDRAIPEYSQEDIDIVKGPGLVQSMLDIAEDSGES